MAHASLVLCALVANFFLFGYSLTCSSFWNCQFGDLGYVCLGGGLLFFSLWLFSHVLQCFGIANLEILVIMCAWVAYFFFSLWLLSHVLQFLELPICRSWLCVLLFGYSLMCSRFCELPIWRSWLCVLWWPTLFSLSLSLSLSLWLFSHALQLFWNCQFGEPFQVHKSFRHSRFQEFLIFLKKDLKW